MIKWQKVCALLLCSMLLLLQACKSTGDKENQEQDVTPTVTPTAATVTQEYHTIAPGSTTELPIYSVNANTLELEAVTALVPADSVLTPELVVEAVLDAMADSAYFVEVAGITTSEDMVTVDFYKQGPPVTNVGSGVELAILDAIGQSLLDNLAEYNKVSYTIEGEAYQTGHVELSLGESYIER